MKTLMTVAAGFLIVVAVGAQDDDAVKKEKEVLKGVWKIESLETQQGKKDDFAEATLEFKTDGNIAFTKGNENKKATYTINPAGKPKEIDLKPEGKDDAMVGIYRVEKETLTLCLAEGPGAARPNEFAAKDNNVLVTLKRVK